MHTAECAIDIIGVMLVEMGQTLAVDSGNEFPKKLGTSGCHINIRLLVNSLHAGFERDQ